MSAVKTTAATSINDFLTATGRASTQVWDNGHLNQRVQNGAGEKGLPEFSPEFFSSKG